MIAGYCRCSTEEQTKLAYNTIDAQTDLITSWINLHKPGSELKMYSDGGYSGGNTNRPALQKLLIDIEAGSVSAVVVMKLDRITRSLADFAHLQKLMSKHNVDFASVSESFDTSTAIGRATVSLIVLFAQLEREMGGERVMMKRRAMFEQGLFPGGSIAPGYKSAGNGYLAIDEEMAVTVVKVFETYCQTASISRTAYILSRDGIVTPRARGTLWHTSTVKGIVDNAMYAGMIHFQGELKPSEYLPVFVPTSLFEQAQKLRAACTNGGGKVQRRGDHPLSGLVFCGACGARLYVDHARGEKGNEYRRFRCGETIHHMQLRCPGNYASENNLDVAVFSCALAIVKEWRPQENFDDDRTNTIAATTSRLLELADKRRRITTGYIAGGITHNEYESMIQEIDQEEKELHSESDEVNIDLSPLQAILPTFAEYWTEMDEDKKRVTARSIFQRIELNNHIVTAYPNTNKTPVSAPLKPWRYYKHADVMENNLGV